MGKRLFFNPLPPPPPPPPPKKKKKKKTRESRRAKRARSTGVGKRAKRAKEKLFLCSPPPTPSRLLFCAGVRFTLRSFPASNDRRKIKYEKIEGSEQSRNGRSLNVGGNFVENFKIRISLFPTTNPILFLQTGCSGSPGGVVQARGTV